MFTDLGDEGGEAVQSNQFLIVDGDTGALIDPGGNLAYSDLYLAMSQHFPPSKLSALIASHADPDIIASLDRWTTATQAKIYISRLWERFVPHFCKPGKTTGRIVGIPDPGMRIRIGRSELIALPAHFMHAEGNFQFYDPASGILFSGDLGVSLGSGAQAGTRCAVAPPACHPGMEAFHQPLHGVEQGAAAVGRHGGAAAHRMIVPQHGAPHGRAGGARVHRLGARPALRHRPLQRGRGPDYARVRAAPDFTPCGRVRLAPGPGRRSAQCRPCTRAARP
jgi:flavorubredoxin